MLKKSTLVLTLALLAFGCAPRVSKRAPNAYVAAQPEKVAVAPVKAVQPVQQDRSMVQAKQQPQPAVVAAPVQKAKLDEPAPAPSLAKAQPAQQQSAQPAAQQQAQQQTIAKAEPAKASVDNDADDDDSEASYAPEQTTKTASARKSFYSFSDDEITSMRRRSRDFKKLHDKLMSCTTKSEKTIAKREQLRDKIIALQNTEYRTPKQDRELNKLRSDERKMLSSRGEDSKDCSELEGRLTEMLRVAYGTQGA